jgi:molybdopterin/thiamine biosynthesis adenylyltransferase
MKLFFNKMTQLTKEDEALYDRQIRLWGRDAQERFN